jgi:hypothetical protein
MTPFTKDADVTRTKDDILGEALRRCKYGLMQPLWADIPEDQRKAAWRAEGRDWFERDNEWMVDNMRHLKLMDEFDAAPEK